MAVPGKKASKRFSSSTIQIGSGEDLQVYCQPCHDEEGKILPAHGYCTDCKEHLCWACFTFHKKHKLSKHHTLLDATRMPKSLQRSETSIHTSQSEDLNTPCGKHPRETIKFYCDDHKALLCSVCVTLEHIVTSCKVNYIPDISGNIIDSTEYHDTLKAVDEVVDQYSKVKEDVKKMMDKSNNSLKDVLEDINNFRQEINKRLDELETQATHAANVQQIENDKNAKIIETTYKDMANSLKTLSDTMKQLNVAKQADNLFMKLKLTEKTLKDIEGNVLQLTSYDVKEHIFTPNETIRDMLKKEELLGVLTQKMSNSTSLPETIQIKSKKLLYKGAICVKSSEDQNRCWITGMTVVSPDILIITDHNNKVVKMVDVERLYVTDQLQLIDAPWDITSVTRTRVAVTLPGKSRIQFISVSSNKLILRNGLNVYGKCYGINCCQSKLVVSFYDPAMFKILDMNGTVLATGGKNTFFYPQYILSSNRSIYVSDLMLAQLPRCNWKGEVSSSYSGMKDSRGLALSDDGTIYVCRQLQNVIEEIKEGCSSRKIALEYVNGPWAVCWRVYTRKLFYSCNTEKDKDDNYIKCHKAYVEQ